MLTLFMTRTTLSNNKSFRLTDVTKMILWAEIFIAKEKEDILNLKSIPCNMPPTQLLENYCSPRVTTRSLLYTNVCHQSTPCSTGNLCTRSVLNDRRNCLSEKCLSLIQFQFDFYQYRCTFHSTLCDKDFYDLWQVDGFCCLINSTSFTNKCFNKKKSVVKHPYLSPQVLMIVKHRVCGHVVKTIYCL